MKKETNDELEIKDGENLHDYWERTKEARWEEMKKAQKQARKERTKLASQLLDLMESPYVGGSDFDLALKMIITLNNEVRILREEIQKVNQWIDANAKRN